ncbi:Uncharacterised protein [Mycobacteroides abscessus subsp. bolletii]|nr:Uncharacterised protein [Mycobacteroides abscessus subsp. bolletii]SKS53588.1 Uncharacterised protein [Mycobacteroides abscessus subsp. abscessus]SHW77039.1 Uncharacterised protein [Mycobacteroides abscessus subsp. bolletii]SHX37103.1 Uncharacterised protein [Mycobacteroides abscessus subsp. bolletii]SHX57993.1 Uncharacterised protein [Mycobacteroides abscessus subsp. bolletii]
MSDASAVRARYFEAVRLLLTNHDGPIRCPLNSDADLVITGHPRGEVRSQDGKRKLEYELRCPSCEFREWVLAEEGQGPYTFE